MSAPYLLPAPKRFLSVLLHALLPLLFLLPLPAHATAARIALAAGLALGGTLNFYLTPPSNGTATQGQLSYVPVYIGSGALAAAFLIHPRVLTGFARDFARYPGGAAGRAVAGATFTALRNAYDPQWEAKDQARYYASLFGMWTYAANRGWGAVREMTVPPEPYPGFRVVAPTWIANQASGTMLDLASIALMEGVAMGGMKLFPGQEAHADHYYDGYSSFAQAVLSQYAITAMGSLTAGVCATGMTYLFPAGAAVPGGRLPCHFARLAVRSGARYFAEWLKEGHRDDWQDAFWAKEAWNIPSDAVNAFFMNRWWDRPANAYMRDLGALAWHEEPDAPVLNIHMPADMVVR